MDYIEDYQPTHYNYYLKKCEEIIGDCTDIDCWVRNISLKYNIVWIKASKFLKLNTPDYNVESSTLITLLICLFIFELDVPENKVVLSNAELRKLAIRFDKLIRLEYGFKRDKLERGNYKHTLLKDVEQ